MSSATEVGDSGSASARHWGRRCRGWRIGVARGHVELLQFSRERTPWSSSSASESSCCYLRSVFDDEIAPGVSFRHYYRGHDRLA
jgi:hypothetical protein